MSNFLKTPVGIIAAVAGFLGIVAAIVIEQLNGISPANLVNTILIVLGFLGIGGVAEKTRQQTNGTLSARDDKISELSAKLETALGLLPAEQAEKVHAAGDDSDTVTPETEPPALDSVNA